MHSHTHCPPQPYNSLKFGNEKNPNIHSHYHQKGVRETEKNSKDLTHLSCCLVHTCARTRASTRTHTRSSCPSAAAQSPGLYSGPQARRCPRALTLRSGPLGFSHRRCLPPCPSQEPLCTAQNTFLSPCGKTFRSMDPVFQVLIYIRLSLCVFRLALEPGLG